MLPQASRAFRDLSQTCESSSGPEAVPFLQDGSSQQSLDLGSEDLEEGVLGRGGDKTARVLVEPCSDPDDDCTSSQPEYSFSPSRSRWARRWRIQTLYRHVLGRRASLRNSDEKPARGARRRSPSALRRIFRIIGYLLMLLGFLHFVTLAGGLYLSFFSNEAPWPDRFSYYFHRDGELGQWPTDITADISPVECHSHNDYWRKEPLFSALAVGCTSVEADVFAYKDDLFVGHSSAALTSSRTLRSLYIDPLLKILDKMNPITDFHPSLNVPRNGIFDTRPRQSLVLLIDFKKTGEDVWPLVHSQLQPFRDQNYLTYWNGSSVVEGPITVVVTGNAPFHKVVESQSYRDMFYDAPLDLMAKVPSDISPQHRVSDEQDISTFGESNAQGGQGHSASAPTDPVVYSPANSYYASVSFKRTILGFPTLAPWRNKLSKVQMDLIRKQIAGAHARGLKVRYWSVPEWPRGLRNYFWRILVKEGVDYLNVDDLKAVTTETWLGGKRWEAKERGWWFTWT